MDNGQRPGGNLDVEKLQQALRAFGGSSTNNNSIPPSSSDIAALAQRMGISVPGSSQSTFAPPTSSGLQFMFVQIANTDLALPANLVAGVERVADVTRVPNTASWVLGVANLRGSITSVIDFRSFLGLPSEASTSRSRIVVASVRGMSIGFLVDSVNEIRAIPPESLQREGVRQVSPPWIAPYLEAYTQYSGRSVYIVDIERLVFTDSLHRYRVD
jgi:purine-binding chemotaxis protein CheW